MFYAASEALLEGLHDVLWKEVDEGWVRFDPAAGQTLLLAPITRFVLEQLAVPGLKSDTDLIDALQREESEATHEECEAAVADALRALLNARLIRAETS